MNVNQIRRQIADAREDRSKVYLQPDDVEALLNAYGALAGACKAGRGGAK